MPALDPAAVRGAPGQRFESLAHPLSDVMESLSSHRTARVRSETEMGACEWLDRNLEAGLESPRRFGELLGVINVRVTDAPLAWRRAAIGIGADAAGNRIRFPPAAAIASQIARIRSLLLGDDPALFRATVALALLVNCHPFVDGNGRSARVLFNSVLRSGGMPSSVYVPFSELASRARGGYEIALRQAEIHGQWEPLLEWVVAMLNVHRRLAQGPDRRSGSPASGPSPMAGCRAG